MIGKHAFAMLALLVLTGGAMAQGQPAPNRPAELSAGHIMEARIMGLNPHVFSRAEIAQIEDEPTWRDRRQRIRMLLERKVKAGEDISHPFTSSEWRGVDGGIAERYGRSAGSR